MRDFLIYAAVAFAAFSSGAYLGGRLAETQTTACERRHVDTDDRLARLRALDEAMKLDHRRSTHDASSVTADAEMIYRWLTKAAP